MTSRERVNAAIEFKGPDRVPFTHAFFPGALWRHGSKVIELMERHPDDFGNRGFRIPSEPAEAIEEYTDEWGTTWHRRRGYSAGEVLRPALDTWDLWPGYAFPPEPAQRDWDGLKAAVGDRDRDWYALTGWVDLFERMQFLRGTENLLLDFAEDRPELHEMADHILDRNLRLIQGYIRSGVDGIWFSDDWGSQDRLLINPSMWRRFFKQRYSRMIELIRDAGRHVFFHTCGWTMDIWDDLIELGVNVINPQNTLFSRDVLEEKLSGRICVFADADRQHVMPLGTPEEVREIVRNTISTFSRSGGVMLRFELEPVWPYENIEAMYEAYDVFGRTGTED